MVLIYKKKKSRINKTIIGGAYSEVPKTEKDQRKLDKLKKFTIIRCGSVLDNTPSQEKLLKFVSLRLT
jgi:hypothetical protein